MATYNKDFVVKNGLVVNDGATFGNAISIGTPTADEHATTKSYVDALVASSGGGGGGASVTVGGTEPSSPSNGDLWFDTNIDRLKVYYTGVWIVMATYDDTEQLVQHIHDTSIDGTGLVIDTYPDQLTNVIDGGSPSTVTFGSVLDGGTV